MSTRSQVRSVIYGTVSQVDDFIKANQELLDIVHADIGIEFLLHEDEKVIHLNGDYIKWYEDYPAVIAWKDLLEKAQSAGLEYEFMELGEEEFYNYKCTDNARSLVGYSRVTELNI